METMYHYLYRIRVLPNGSQREIESAKLKYRKLYKKAKQQEYSKTRKRVELTYSLTEYEQLQREAKKAGIGVPIYLRRAIYAARNKQAFLPDDSQLYDLKMEIRRIGNNINQLAYYANRNKYISIDTLRLTQDHLTEIENLITRSFQPK